MRWRVSALSLQMHGHVCRVVHGKDALWVQRHAFM
jgi:hypothetical protein